MKELTLKLTVDEVNLILEGLGNMDFKTVFALVNKIQTQAEDQLKENAQKPQPGSVKAPPADAGGVDPK